MALHKSADGAVVAPRGFRFTGRGVRPSVYHLVKLGAEGATYACCSTYVPARAPKLEKLKLQPAGTFAPRVCVFCVERVERELGVIAPVETAPPAFDARAAASGERQDGDA